jgi:hypothetical protein
MRDFLFPFFSLKKNPVNVGMLIVSISLIQQGLNSSHKSQNLLSMTIQYIQNSAIRSYTTNAIPDTIFFVSINQ